MTADVLDLRPLLREKRAADMFRNVPALSPQALDALDAMARMAKAANSGRIAWASDWAPMQPSHLESRDDD